MMRGCDVGADTGWCVTSGKLVGVAADSGNNVGALAASGGVVGLILLSSTYCATDSSSSTGRGGRSLRVGDGKPSLKKKKQCLWIRRRLVFSGRKPYNRLCRTCNP